MRILNRTAMAIFDLTIGILAALASWIQFSHFGIDAWRLFATWVALGIAIYYILDGLVAIFLRRREVGRELCPTFQGSLIVSSILLLIFQLVCYAMDNYTPSTGVNVFLIELILPILMIISWVMFSLKGQWHATDPFYWLALPTIYFATILVSGEFMSRSSRLTYPYEFLNYPQIGIDTMLWWFAIFAVVTLIVGYVFWLLDFAISGQLSQRIVMPKIKTVVIEEEVEDADEAGESEVIEKPEEKPVKLITTGSRNLPVAKQTQSKSAPSKKTASSNSKQSSQAEPSTRSRATTKHPPVRIIEKIEVAEVKKPSSPQEESKITEKTKSDEKTSAKPSKTNFAPETKAAKPAHNTDSVSPKSTKKDQVASSEPEATSKKTASKSTQKSASSSDSSVTS